MKIIRKRRNCFALLFVVSICLAVYCGAIFTVETAIFFGIISIVFFILLVRQSCLLYYAALILDNRILSVSSAFIFTQSTKVKNYTEEIVVSTFGILAGSKIYRWGIDGVHGVRLITARIDRARMQLIFGCADQNMQVELLHGMTEQQDVLNVAKRLRDETGVTAKISDW